jgi:hypothetical protein
VGAELLEPGGECADADERVDGGVERGGVDVGGRLEVVAAEGVEGVRRGPT